MIKHKPIRARLPVVLFVVVLVAGAGREAHAQLKGAYPPGCSRALRLRPRSPSPYRSSSTRRTRSRTTTGTASRPSPADREWAYDRQSHVGKLDKALDEGLAKGWTIVDMKKDWKRVYPFEK